MLTRRSSRRQRFPEGDRPGRGERPTLQPQAAAAERALSGHHPPKPAVTACRPAPSAPDVAPRAGAHEVSKPSTPDYTRGQCFLGSTGVVENAKTPGNPGGGLRSDALKVRC